MGITDLGSWFRPPRNEALVLKRETARAPVQGPGNRPLSSPGVIAIKFKPGTPDEINIKDLKGYEAPAIKPVDPNAITQEKPPFDPLTVPITSYTSALALENHLKWLEREPVTQEIKNRLIEGKVRFAELTLMPMVKSIESLPESRERDVQIDKAIEVISKAIAEIMLINNK